MFSHGIQTDPSSSLLAPNLSPGTRLEAKATALVGREGLRRQSAGLPRRHSHHGGVRDRLLLPAIRDRDRPSGRVFSGVHGDELASITYRACGTRRAASRWLLANTHPLGQACLLPPACLRSTWLNGGASRPPRSPSGPDTGSESCCEGLRQVHRRLGPDGQAAHRVDALGPGGGQASGAGRRRMSPGHAGAVGRSEPASAVASWENAETAPRRVCADEAPVARLVIERPLTESNRTVDFRSMAI
jgi:hypothetical protein